MGEINITLDQVRVMIQKWISGIDIYSGSNPPSVQLKTDLEAIKEAEMKDPTNQHGPFTPILRVLADYIERVSAAKKIAKINYRQSPSSSGRGSGRRQVNAAAIDQNDRQATHMAQVPLVDESGTPIHFLYNVEQDDVPQSGKN